MMKAFIELYFLLNDSMKEFQNLNAHISRYVSLDSLLRAKIIRGESKGEFKEHQFFTFSFTVSALRTIYASDGGKMNSPFDKDDTTAYFILRQLHLILSQSSSLELLRRSNIMMEYLFISRVVFSQISLLPLKPQPENFVRYLSK